MAGRSPWKVEEETVDGEGGVSRWRGRSPWMGYEVSVDGGGLRSQSMVREVSGWWGRGGVSGWWARSQWMIGEESIYGWRGVSGW